jgi:hypothetical protein
MRSAVLWAAAGMTSLALWTGCDVDRAVSGHTETEPVSIEADDADHANVELNMGAGEVNVDGGAAKLVEGSLDYNSVEGKPRVLVSQNGGHETITIGQSDHGPHFGNSHSAWNLKLNDKALLDLTLNCGAGQARLNLGETKLRSVDVHMGAGQVDLDLTGNPRRDYEVNIHGGVGQATVHLPQGVGVWARAHGGIGSIDVTGLEKRGDHWESDNYDKAKVTVHVVVEGGIGEIRLIG